MHVELGGVPVPVLVSVPSAPVVLVVVLASVSEPVWSAGVPVWQAARSKAMVEVDGDEIRITATSYPIRADGCPRTPPSV